MKGYCKQLCPTPNFLPSNNCMSYLFGLNNLRDCKYDPCKIVQCVNSLNNKNKSNQTYNVDFFKTQCPTLDWKRSC